MSSCSILKISSRKFFLEAYDYSFIFFTFMYWEISTKVFRESVFSFDLIHVVFLFKIERILSVGKCHQVRRKLWFHLTPTKEKLWFHRHRLKSVRLRMYWEGRRKLIGSCWCFIFKESKSQERVSFTLHLFRWMSKW